MSGSKKRIFDGLTKDQRNRLKNLDAYRERHRLYMQRWRENPENAEKHRLASRASYARNREANRAYRKRYHLKKAYGLTEEARDTLIESQGGCCAICRVNLTSIGSRATHVDHCHVTGIVRGILCHPCNTKLGWYERNADAVGAYLAAQAKRKIS
jgi:hypothetical protein